MAHNDYEVWAVFNLFGLYSMVCRITMHFLLISYLLILKMKKANSKHLMSFKSEIGHLKLLLLAVLKIESGTLFIAGQTLYH